MKTFRNLNFLLFLSATFVCGFVMRVQAGLRGPGKYSGVVIFDRWDTCLLLSGPYITYISDSVKNELRPYRGSAVQIYASDVLQPVNPGDALVRKYTLIGPAPIAAYHPAIDGVALNIESDFHDKKAGFRLAVQNISDKQLEIVPDEVGPALLGANRGKVFSASDGRSVAWITRLDLGVELVTRSAGAWTFQSNEIRYSLFYNPSDGFSKRFILQPGKSAATHIVLNLPAGEYQFMVGYGGGVHEGRSTTSNAISFDIDSKGLPEAIETSGSNSW